MMLFKPNLRAVKAAAAAEAELLLPTHYPCREDLVNNTPTDLVARADGSRVAGTVNISDVIPGSASPAIWAYYPTLTALAVLTFIVGVSAAYLGAWVPLSSIAEAWRAGSGVLGSLWYAAKITVVGWMLWDALPAAGVVAQMYYWYLVLSEQEPSRDLYRVWTTATSLIVVLCIVVPFVGPLGCAVTSLLSIIGFRLYIGSLEKARDDIIRDVSADTRTATILKGRDAQEQARKAQAANSLRDNTNLIPIGRSDSTLRRDGDLLTADPGAIMCHTERDVEDAHMYVKGKSGTGKTTRFIRPWLRWFIAATWDRQTNRGRWGIAVFDGIKNLAQDLKDCLQVIVTPRTHRINMLTGVPVELASMTLMQMRSKGPDEGGWQGKVEAMCRHALRMVELCSQLKDPNGEAAFPDIHYSWTCVDNWIKQPELRKVTMMKVYEDFRDTLAPEHIKKTWIYWCVEWPEMANETRTSIMGIWTQWIDALVAHPDMQAWCGHESDIDLLDFWCRQAGRAGVDCPETVYGVGGKIAATLIEAALENRILQRVQYGGGAKEAWMAAGENPVLTVVDEFGNFGRPGHVLYVTAARSLGGILLVAVQDDGMLDTALGSKESGDTFRNNCHFRVTFPTDDRSLEESCKQAGERERWFPDDSAVSHAPLLELTRMEVASGLVDASRNRLLNVAGSIAGVISRRKHMLASKHRDHSDIDASNPMRAIATLKGKTRVTQTIEPGELKMALVAPGMALVSYPRAKVQRRGICYMAADYEMKTGPGAGLAAQARIEQQPPNLIDIELRERAKATA